MSRRDIACLWVPGPLPGLNELIEAAKGAAGRGARYAKLKRQWTETVWALALSARIHRPGPFDRPVVLTFDWIEKDRRRDPDNVAAGGRKLILDGLVTAGVLKGDGWRWIRSWHDRWRVADEVVCGKGPGVGVTITPIDGSVLMGASEVDAQAEPAGHAAGSPEPRRDGTEDAPLDRHADDQRRR